jgi:hypothetical protein
MPKKKKGVKFSCIYCRLEETYDEYVHPKQWYKMNYARIGEYRQRCRICGAFMFPSVWAPQDDEGFKQVFDMFSICKNAAMCHKNGLYRPDCENQRIKPDCLQIIFEGIADVSSRLEKLEKLYSSLNPPKL